MGRMSRVHFTIDFSIATQIWKFHFVFHILRQWLLQHFAHGAGGMNIISSDLMDDNRITAMRFSQFEFRAKYHWWNGPPNLGISYSSD